MLSQRAQHAKLGVTVVTVAVQITSLARRRLAAYGPDVHSCTLHPRPRRPSAPMLRWPIVYECPTSQQRRRRRPATHECRDALNPAHITPIDSSSSNSHPVLHLGFNPPPPPPPPCDRSPSHSCGVVQ